MVTYLKKHYAIAAGLLFFIVFSYTPVFLHLENMPVRKFDEARLAINAYEMNKNGNYIVVHYEEEPEMWNTKPPLMLWAQVFFIKLLGYNELAIRLPSAIAALLTGMALFLFGAYYLKKPVLGFMAAAILFTSSFISIHFSRTGDYDAMLTLFTTVYILCFFICCNSSDIKIKNKYLGFFFICLTLAVLTKGVAALLFTPALFMYALAKRQVLPLAKNKRSYLFLLLFIAVAGGYYFIREALNPGYISMVMKNEMGGRFLETIEGHSHGPLYYYDFLLDEAFMHWYLFVLPGIALALFAAETKLSNLALLLLLAAFSFLIIISWSETKIHWYVMPALPVLALCAALFFYWLFYAVQSLAGFLPASRYTIAPYVMLFFVLWTPYNDKLDKVYFPTENSWEKEAYAMSHYLKAAADAKKDLSGVVILHESYHPEIMFYVLRLKEMGQELSFIYRYEVAVDDIVIAHESELKNYIEANFKTEVIDEWENVRRYRILSANPG